MMNEQAKLDIRARNTAIGIELGSTRIKAVLIGPDHMPLASGSHDWENSLIDKVWTYSIDEVWEGLRDCWASLARDVKEKYDEPLTGAGAIGISAMMHGYMAFDENDELLVPFRTWRNTMTAQASEKLTELFNFNVPQRWSISHLYQAMLRREEHLPRLKKLDTLAVYVHRKLTGLNVAGVGEASGMFPIDRATGTYDETMVQAFEKAAAEAGYPVKLRDILPTVLTAGDDAGTLTKEGALLLDPTGVLEGGIPMCPPEGDAGTGMAATNSVRVGTGNVSAGTSIFSMIVLDKPLKNVHMELDVVTTPAGDPVAMVHCNNCTSDINGYVSLFGEFACAIGHPVDNDTLYGTLYRAALNGKKNGGGMVSFNYLSGEAITQLDEGRPLFLRGSDVHMDLGTFMRTHLMSCLATLKIGNDILIREEGAACDTIFGHGGLFKTAGVGQSLLAAALDTPVSVMKTAGEGGPWGMALLAMYMLKGKGISLADYLSEKVFASSESTTIAPDPEDVKGFDEFIETYKKCLKVERSAVEAL